MLVHHHHRVNYWRGEVGVAPKTGQFSPIPASRHGGAELIRPQREGNVGRTTDVLHVLHEVATAVGSGRFFDSKKKRAGTVIFCYNLLGLFDKKSNQTLCMYVSVKSFPRVRPGNF